MMTSYECVIITVTILYVIIASFIVADAYFDFKLSHSIRKFFGGKR